MSTDSPVYDLAFSFAGEQRSYVEATKVACEALGLRVFYDRDKNNEWWGKNFIVEQRKVYGSQTRFFVPFISTEYLAKPIPNDEFQAAMMTAVKRGDAYVLPVLMDAVDVPAELLHPHVHYLRSTDYDSPALAEQMRQRVVRAGVQQVPREIAEVVSEALELRLPKVEPPAFSTFKELRTVFDYLAAQYENAVPQLARSGFVGDVEKLERQLLIRVEKAGRTVYALDIRRGSSMGGADSLEFSVDNHRGTTGVNGWARPVFDTDAGIPKLDVMDFSLLRTSGSGATLLTKEELFKMLWDRLIDRLEGRG